MGYKSEVTIAIAFVTKGELDAFIAPRLLQEEIAENKGCFERSEGQDNVLVFHVDEWKWYDNYPEVQAILELMREAPTYGGAYRFMRIGEDYTDIEQSDSYGESEQGVCSTATRCSGYDALDLLDNFRLVSFIESSCTVPLKF